MFIRGDPLVFFEKTDISQDGSGFRVWSKRLFCSKFNGESENQIKFYYLYSKFSRKSEKTYNSKLFEPLPEFVDGSKIYWKCPKGSVSIPQSLETISQK